MSPRKSSTSSGRPARPRARYLGVEVAGEPLPSPTPAAWTTGLRTALELARGSAVRFRIVRSDGGRAIVQLSHREVGEARSAWSGASTPFGEIRPVRTWGTLLGAKAWLGRRPGGARIVRSRARRP